MTNSLQPFLIGEMKTGLFDYLEPWRRPLDAFQPMQNAFVFRGKLQKRSGYTFFGVPAYRDSGVSIAVGTGIKTYAGTLAIHPIRAGTFNPTDGVESFTDNGAGVLTGTAGGSGTINYSSSTWTLSFNANVGAGVVIRGSYTYVPTAISVPVVRPIMGLKTWVDELTESKHLIALDTGRASIYNAGTRRFDPLYLVSQDIFMGDAVATSATVLTQWANLAPYTVTLFDGTSTIIDDGLGGFPASGNFKNSCTVNYASGSIFLDFNAAPAAGIIITATFSLSGDYFHGSNSNFFNAINWLGDMYMTNDIDFITLFDGTNLSRPPFPITRADKEAYVNDIATCLDIDVYKNRLLVQKPTLVGTSTPSQQSVRYSAVNNPTNLVADVTGNGGEISAPTDDAIASSEFLRDVAVFFFGNSTWTFRYTGSGFDPFRWDKINVTKSCNAPYGTIPYDEQITAMGAEGLIACQGTSVQRYDLEVIDQFLDINQNRFPQCYGTRFDTLNQSWMLYPSNEANSSTSDRALVYNFIESTWAVYSLAMSCLGVYFVIADARWEDFAVGQPLESNWEDEQLPWNSYLYQGLAPTLLGGGLDGIVYTMNDGLTDNGAPIEASITSARWNPFSEQAKNVQFAYIDFYYKKSPEAILTLSFFVDNSESAATTRQLACTGPTNSSFAIKRIYINATGEFLRMSISSNSVAEFEVLGMVLWAKPAGRWTP